MSHILHLHRITRSLSAYSHFRGYIPFSLAPIHHYSTSRPDFSFFFFFVFFFFFFFFCCFVLSRCVVTLTNHHVACSFTGRSSRTETSYRVYRGGDAPICDISAFMCYPSDLILFDGIIETRRELTLRMAAAFRISGVMMVLWLSPVLLGRMNFRKVEGRVCPLSVRTASAD